ncbi:4-(cytidine 5'-diphospho)-2-C-methyl-D-erythritol kinase [Sphingomonas lenta]|uniref:4-diphosphocytidyl-2-C-methyl-D-erythritol kinase n=1 Tax=Sphingomonas lenta TaxID=1141887 RepID=A0A2A2SK06_9SPHN|nr:4-(cytidine 5'-diphospho)-2-C-methyl-D-erythritol kinase [Sphingomonas lenta]PAX09563.1 4-(cytidine 5'-diphospho)-2-C-methyl-D-erythritol kinase [Sphingomonas lenta]
MIREPAPAKLNLALHVRARRPDGYHDLETLFAFCRDGDLIELAPAEANRFAIAGPFAAALEESTDNLVTRAAQAFATAFGVTRPHAITLTKNLPVASGIGGGSADAAATLRALARLHGVPLDRPDLHALAAELGADVPACLLGRTAIGRGRGDALRPVPGLPSLPVLLVNPGVPVSTAAVFARWDGADRGPLGGGDPLSVARAGRNDLEPAARALAPEIDEVLALLSAQPGVLLARMSGSGATCFALFEDERARAVARDAVAERGWWRLETALA